MLLLLLACGVAPGAFDDEYAGAFCERHLTCDDAATLALLGWSSEADCRAALEPEGGCDGFSRRAAARCLDGIEAMSCRNVAADAWPEECAAVCP